MKVGNKRNQGFVAFVVFVSVLAHAQSLRSPWDAHKIQLTDAAYNCPAPPPFSKTMYAESYYIDEHHSIIDPEKKLASEKATEAPTHLAQSATQAADAYLTKGSKPAAQCGYSLLTAAAQAQAWSDEMPTGQANYEQKWLLSGTAIAYLKVRGSGVGTAEQDKVIQKWLGSLAARVRQYVEKKRSNPNSDAWNNHLYWAGLAVSAAGIAINNRDDFEWGLKAYKAGAAEIRDDGSLPREMARAGMALHYHLYSVAPLVMLAELGEANGIDLYAENHGSIHRLVRFCKEGLLDPGGVAKAAGVAQTMPAKISGTDVGWAVPYVKRFPDSQLSTLISQAQWTSFWQWGGLPPE